MVYVNLELGMSDPVCDFLRDLIGSYLASKGESLRWLSNRSKVDYQKLYRLDAGEAKGFGFFDAKRLLTTIAPDKCVTALREFYPAEMQSVSDLSLPESELNRLFEAADFIISSFHYYDFYLFLAQTPGLNRLGVEKRYGSYGIELLDAFVSKGAISEVEGKFVGILETDMAQPTPILKKICHAHIEMVGIDQPGGFCGQAAQRLSLQGRQEAYKVVVEAWHRLLEIFNSPEHRGDQTTLITLCFGSLKGEQS